MLFLKLANLIVTSTTYSHLPSSCLLIQYLSPIPLNIQGSTTHLRERVPKPLDLAQGKINSGKLSSDSWLLVRQEETSSPNLPSADSSRSFVCLNRSSEPSEYSLICLILPFILQIGRSSYMPCNRPALPFALGRASCIAKLDTKGELLYRFVLIHIQDLVEWAWNGKERGIVVT